MKTIRLTRPKERFNSNCSYKIFINDRLITTLKNGEDKVIDVNESISNSLQVKIQWCGSKKITTDSLKNNETIQISGNVLFNRYLLIFTSLIPITGILIAQNRETKTLGLILIVIVLILLIGTLTIWKNHWIDLT